MANANKSRGQVFESFKNDVSGSILSHENKLRENCKPVLNTAFIMDFRTTFNRVSGV